MRDVLAGVILAATVSSEANIFLWSRRLFCEEPPLLHGFVPTIASTDSSAEIHTQHRAE